MDIQILKLMDILQNILKILREALNLVPLKMNPGKARDVLDIFFSNIFLAFYHNCLSLKEFVRQKKNIY